MMSQNDESCLLCLKNVSYKINSKAILSNISVKIEELGITGIIGPSGSGKSTLLRIINRLISPSAGTILLEGKDYIQFTPQQLRKRIGLVQQKPFLFPGTVKENLLYGPKIWDLHYSDKELINLLKKVALSATFLEREVDNLSVGEQQRVSLARSLANNPKILLLDEPTSALDIVSEEIIENSLKSLRDEGLKIIIVTHSLDQTKRLADQLLFLKEGRLEDLVTATEFFKRYDEATIRGFFKKDNKGPTSQRKEFKEKREI
ncbi:MAG: phosphate ABC transporter ATP-binding protein [Promethearchaeia archaeon]